MVNENKYELFFNAIKIHSFLKQSFSSMMGDAYKSNPDIQERSLSNQTKYQEAIITDLGEDGVANRSAPTMASNQSSESSDSTNAKGFFNYFEKQLFVKTMETHGKNWDILESLMPGKTKQQLKNYFYNHKRKIEEVISEKPAQIYATASTISNGSSLDLFNGLLTTEQQALASQLLEQAKLEYTSVTNNDFPEDLHAMCLQHHLRELDRENKVESRKVTKVKCIESGCSKRRVTSSNYCLEHGGFSACSEPECRNESHLGGFCLRHLPQNTIKESLRAAPETDEINQFSSLENDSLGFCHASSFTSLLTKFDIVPVDKRMEQYYSNRPPVIRDPFKLDSKARANQKTCYRRVFTRLFTKSLENTCTVRVDESIVLPKDLAALPPGWQTEGKKKSGKIISPDGTLLYGSLQDVLNDIMPETTVVSYQMPLADFFILFKDCIHSSCRAKWTPAIASRDPLFDFTIRLTDYPTIRRAIGLCACRTKLTTEDYVVSSLPMLVSYSLDTNSVNFKVDTKYVQFAQLPKSLVSLFPQQMHTPMDTK